MNRLTAFAVGAALLVGISAAADARTLRYAQSSFGEENLDPTVTSIVAAVGTGGPLWDWLTELDADGSLRPRLATSWQQSDDRLSWTLDLRDDATFHDGSPVTAEDVRFSLLEGFGRPESKASRAPQFRKAIKDVVAVDPHKVRIELTSPWPTLPYDISTQAGVEGIVLPKAYIERVGWDAFAREPVGSGPWKFARHQMGDMIEYEANESYWGGAPRFDKLRLLLVPEESTRLAMLSAGEVDIADITLDSVPVVEGEGMQVVADPQRSSVRVQLYGTYYDEALPTADPRVRKALNLAINRQELVDALFGGSGNPAAVFPIGPLSIGYPADLQPYPFDPEEARRLLDEAGQSGFRIKLYSMPVGGLQIHQQVAEAVAGYWEAIGVRTEVVPTDFGAFRPMYMAHPTPEALRGQASVFATTARVNGLDDLTPFWVNQGGLAKMAAPGEIDAEYAAANQASSTEEIASNVAAAYRKLYEDYRGIPLADVTVAVWALGPAIESLAVAPARGYVAPSLSRAVPAAQ